MRSFAIVLFEIQDKDKTKILISYQNSIKIKIVKIIDFLKKLKYICKLDEKKNTLYYTQILKKFYLINKNIYIKIKIQKYLI